MWNTLKYLQFVTLELRTENQGEQHANMWIVKTEE